MSEFIKTKSVVSAGSPKGGKTKDHNSLLTSAQKQSHGNSSENYFRHHCSKTEPLCPLPSSQPRPWGPTLLFILAPASNLFTHIQTTGTREFRRALQQVREQVTREESVRQDLMSRSSSFSLSLGFTAPPARSYSNTEQLWFPESQK